MVKIKSMQYMKSMLSVSSMPFAFTKNIGKKSQFYLFSAFIFVFLFFSLQSSNFISGIDDPFLDLKNNYIGEATKAINSGILDRTSPFLRIDDFTKSFMKYAKTRNVDFGVVYILSENGYLKIVNYLNTDITLYYKGNPIINCVNGICSPLRNSNLAEILWQDELSIRFSGKEYRFEFSSPDEIEFKVLFKGEMRG